MVKRVTMVKMSLGVVLFLFVMGILGGLLYLNFLTGTMRPQGPDGEARIVVMPDADREWFNGSFPAADATALSLLEEANDAENLHLVVDEAGGGLRVMEINARANDPADGEAWHYWVLREGQWRWGGDLRPDWMDLRAGDTVVWAYGSAPQDSATGPAGFAS